MITAGQVKAARKLLGWSREDLASHAGVKDTTIALFEGGEHQSPDWVAMLIRRALEAAGVEFMNGGQPGVRLRKAK
jgi:transcriptional regulator with XRE-family HTH domain